MSSRTKNRVKEKKKQHYLQLSCTKDANVKIYKRSASRPELL